jgi:UDP-N-acetyl-D-mannosaminuronic acid dehydrogenase
MKGSKVAILGWAFIADSDDARNTPSEVYRDLVVSEGAEVSVHDPWVEEYPGVAISSDLERVITGADAVAVFTGHREYRALDPGSLKRWAGVEHPVIVDGRNVVDPDSFIRYGWVYKGIGRGDKNGHAVVGCR